MAPGEHNAAHAILKDHSMKSGAISWALALQLVVPGYSQSPGPEKLNITVVEGEGAVNNIRLRTARDMIVQVDDENRRPVVGAAVVFTLPSQGAGGAFGDGQKTATAVTDQEGRAVVRRFRPNNVAGKMEVRVNASSEGRTGRATITQFNMLVQADLAKKSHTGKIVAIILIAGAAAGGGALAATRKGGGSTPAAPAIPVITITPGSGTMGPPQ